jgi:hypothetical protein
MLICFEEEKKQEFQAIKNYIRDWIQKVYLGLGLYFSMLLGGSLVTDLYFKVYFALNLHFY